jgi:predicted ATPase/class 3 adenylate cyclase/DNA-binding CsgD family transcriptional regulator/tetratricopeptide (TPR) repeat protein
MADVVGSVLDDDRRMGMGPLIAESAEPGRDVMRPHEESGGERALPTGTVTLLLSDVEGSTRLWEADEEAAAAAIARHYELFDTAIAAHRGVRPVEQGEGDSVVAAFASGSDALAAALDVQCAFATERWPTEQDVRVRIALHTGEVRLRDEGNYYGPAIIRCARLRSIGHGGQTLLSDSIRDLVIDGLADDVSLKNLGPQRLKDLGRPERVWQLCHPDLEAEFPPLRSLDAVPNNLPGQLTAFVGRDAEMAELRDLLAQHRLITLSGAGGCGKTRLALQLAAEVAEKHPGGTWWVELAGVTDPELVTANVANAIGVRAEPERPLVETMADYLAGHEALLVLDNCEQVLAPSARLVEELLRSVADLSVLATSREALGITGELAWRVPSLDLALAIQLFIERAELVRPGFMPDDVEMGNIARICERVDGMPLAIELAAARTRMMSPASIAAGLDDRFRLLTGGSRNAQARQQTLEASVAWSHELLDDAERVLLRRLSVFNSGFSLDSAESVCSDEIVDSYSILDLLGHLVDKSLVQTDDLAPENRYRLLETIRHYARDRLLESGETDRVRHRHLGWFLGYAERAEREMDRAGGPTWMDRLDAEHDNLQSALEWAEISGEHETVLRLTTALRFFWETRGHRHQGIGGRWFARALEVDSGPSTARARAMWAAAHMGLYGGDTAAIATWAPQALAMAKAIGDQQTIARAGITVNLVQSLRAPEEGLAGLTESIELAKSIGDQWAVADGLKMMTIACSSRGDHDRALAVTQELAQAAGRLGNVFFMAWSHAAMGNVALHQGDFPEARAWLNKSIALCEEVGDPITRWLAICWLGELDASLGDYASAEARFGQVLRKGAAADGDLAREMTIPALGALLLGVGDRTGASAILEPAAADFENEVPMMQIPFLSVYGDLLLALGDESGARAEYDKSKAAASGIGNARLVADVDYRLGRMARGQGEPVEAEELQHQALATFHGERILPGIAESLEALAGTAIDMESTAEAVRLLGAASSIRASIGLVRRPVDQAVYERDLARARQDLEPDTFAAAWSEGACLSADEVVAYASRARGERKRPSAGWASLTPTEVEVVKLTAKGLSNPEIGARLFIGRATVKTHLAHVFTKLGVTSRAELAAEATRRGMLAGADQTHL